MDAFGYNLRGKAANLPTDFIPSLIGHDPLNTAGPGDDVYFDRIDVIPNRTVTSLAYTRWNNFENGDPILAVKGPAGAYYITKSELEEIVAANQDDDTWEMISKLRRGRVA